MHLTPCPFPALSRGRQQSLLQQPTFYEVIGRVQEDGSLTEMTSIVLGDQFGTASHPYGNRTRSLWANGRAVPSGATPERHPDIALYNDVLTLIPKVPEMFV